MRVLPLALLCVSFHAFSTESRQSASEAQVITWSDLVQIATAHLHQDAQLAEGNRSWHSHGRVASDCLQLANLTGDITYYVQAEAALTQAFALAPEGSGPLLVRAHWQASQHRFNAANNDLKRLASRPLLSEAIRRTIIGDQASCAFALGNYADAERIFLSRALTMNQPQAWFDLANVLSHTGRIFEANACMDKAIAACPPEQLQLRAWLHLQRGLIAWERDLPAEADQWYAAADTILPGWWLIAEHRAEAQAALGHLSESIATYHQLITQTGDPAFMSALSGLYRVQGNNQDQADHWRDAATACYRERIALLPDAMTGHALHHFLDEQYPELHAEGLLLAQQNYASRPAGDAAVGLAKALRLTGDLAGARVVLEDCLASQWQTLSLYHEADQLYSVLGETDRAQAARDQARRLQDGT